MRAGCLRLVLIFSALLVVTAAAAPSGEQGRTWASIAKLPDWSGPWEPHRNAEGGNQRDALPPLVLTPRYDARLKDLLARQAKTHDTQSNTKLCIPSGLPNLMMRITRLYEFLYAPGEVVIHSQTNETRLVYTDGRTHRANFTPSFAGDSVGHWDGGALVIDTVGVRSDAEFVNGRGLLVGDASRDLRIVEHISQPHADELRLDAVLTSETAFAEPYAFSYSYSRSPYPVLEEICAQNNRDIDPFNHAQRFDLNSLPAGLKN